MTNFTDHLGRRRVVITGMACITPMGDDTQSSWEAVVEGRTGIARLQRIDPSDLPTQFGGEIKGFDVNEFLPRKVSKRMARGSQLAVGAAMRAVADAGLSSDWADPERVGVMLGTSIGGIDTLDEALAGHKENGWKGIRPFAVASSLCNMASHHVSLELRALGQIGTQVTACSAGVQSIGDGAEWIRHNRADIVIAGGTDGTIIHSTFSGFCAMHAMPTNFNEHPETASRPFSKSREGFALSEGVGLVILESLEGALARGARIYGEFLGYASSSDGYHMAAPDPTASGAVRSMKWALQDSGITTEQVSYINAHGTSTPLNDKTETIGIKKLFGDRAYDIPVSSIKAIMGHAMGASGSIETIMCLKGINESVIPGTFNYQDPDPECDLDYVPNESRDGAIEYALVNAFGLGGQNASLVVGKYKG